MVTEREMQGQGHPRRPAIPTTTGSPTFHPTERVPLGTVKIRILTAMNELRYSLQEERLAN
jgi:hypothetical protein